MEEVWKPVVGWEDYYQVSNIGNVRSIIREGFTFYGKRKYGGKQLKLIKQKYLKYFVVNLTKKGKREQASVHRLVLCSFVGPCPLGMECCHNDGNRTNNNINNLRWDTHLSNVKDTVSHGRTLRGEKNGFCKLTDDSVVYIRNSKLQTKTLMKMFNSSRTNIVQIRKGNRRKFVK